MKDINLILGWKTDQHGQALNDTVSVRLSKAPHILVGGMTGAGKSVLMHDLIGQILQHHPANASLILIDPKRVEFAAYKGLLPHLTMDPIHEDRYILYVLNWAVAEMNSRFEHMERQGWRDMTDVADEDTPWARIVVVVDELANLMLKGKRFEEPLVTLASMGRAAGVHLILATQRPDAKVMHADLRVDSVAS